MITSAQDSRIINDEPLLSFIYDFAQGISTISGGIDRFVCDDNKEKQDSRTGSPPSVSYSPQHYMRGHVVYRWW